MSGAKRSATEEISSTTVSKVIKLNDTLEIPDDLELSVWKLNKDGSIKMMLIYDTLCENFFLTLTKIVVDSERKITLDMSCVNKLAAQMEKMQLLSGRYSKSGKSVCFSFDLGQETWATLDNKYSSMALDVRKYLNFGGVTKPTKSGVRLPLNVMGELQKSLREADNKIEEVQKQSADVMTKCQYALIRTEIELLHGLQRPFCEGCNIMNPLEDQHMGKNGCLSEEPPCWEQQVDYFFKEAREAIKPEDCVQLAEKVAYKMDVVLIRPEIKVCSEEELKQTIIECKKWEDATFLVAMDG